MKNRCLGILLAVALVSCQPTEKPPAASLDDWNEEIIYFALTDRFADGDSSNNDQGHGEYNPHVEHTYHGGDFAGLLKNLPYLEKLGITALWITPPVRNTLWSRDSTVTGYHGYWASHFAETDPHLGSLKEYQDLAQALHNKQFKLIQDVVTNHTGDYFTYNGPYNAQKPTAHFSHRGAPAQPPFHLNDVRKAAHRKAAIYHFTPSIADYANEEQKLRWQMSDLDDLNTENPVVIEALKKSFRFWIDSVGIDGIRFDTPLYVDHPFWNRFLHDSLPASPGLKTHALTTGKTHFYTFGETWVHGEAYRAEGEQKALKYLGTPEKPEMDGLLHFPMQQSIQRVFAGGAPTSELTYRLQLEDSMFQAPWQRLHFIDNHDMPRFRTTASVEATRQALAFILTIPGIPVIYYGTEQDLLGTRENLFNKQDTLSSHFQMLRDLIALRKSSKAFTRGKLTPVADDAWQTGLLAYELAYKNEKKWVFFNTSESGIQTGNLRINAKSGKLRILSKQGSANLGVIENGILPYVHLGPKAFVIVELATGAGEPLPSTAQFFPTQLPDTLFENTLVLSGKATGFDSLKLLIDGLDALSTPVKLENELYEARISLKNCPEGPHSFTWIGYSGNAKRLAGLQRFYAKLPLEVIKVVRDPKGDDFGPKRTYRYPIGFEGLKSLDLTECRLAKQGNKLLLDISFAAPFSKSWNPPLGFDHLQLMVLLQLNGEKGAPLFAEANYKVSSPTSFTHLISLNGWQIQSFEASPTGTFISKAAIPTLLLTGANSMRLMLDPALLNYPVDIQSLDLHVLTWDTAGEGGLRPLDNRGGDYTFTGGKPTDPKWMDRIILRASSLP